MLDNLKIFVAAAEQRSLTNAALSLGMTIATVSRRMSELEQQLGCELFHRSNKGLTLTPAGTA
ncbi:helix-turn-helix domain-containing protein [Shewanella baltica]